MRKSSWVRLSTCLFNLNFSMREAVSCPSSIVLPLPFLDLSKQALLFLLECNLEYFYSIDQILADDGIGSELGLQAGDSRCQYFLLVFPLPLSNARLSVLLLRGETST